MSRLGFYTTPQHLSGDARKHANKERRRAGRERHEERKFHLKSIESDRRWQSSERRGQRQEQRRDDGTRAFAGRNLDFYHRMTGSQHMRTAGDDDDDDDSDEDDVVRSTGDGHEEVRRQEWHEKGKGREEEEEEEEEELIGAVLLGMARPAKSRRRRRRRPSAAALQVMTMTDGEAFEIVEIDGRLVALDEDGWEILPDENAEASILYSDIVRGTVR